MWIAHLGENKLVIGLSASTDHVDVKQDRLNRQTLPTPSGFGHTQSCMDMPSLGIEVGCYSAPQGGQLLQEDTLLE